MKQFFQKVRKSLHRLRKKLFRKSYNPFYINCFEQLKEEISELSPEEIARIKKKIDEL